MMSDERKAMDDECWVMSNLRREEKEVEARIHERRQLTLSTAAVSYGMSSIATRRK
jgi:hypothetical protein